MADEETRSPRRARKKPRLAMASIVLGAGVVLLFGAVTAAIGTTFVNIVSIAEKTRTETVPRVTQQHQHAVLAAELGRVAEMILGAQSEHARSTALAEAEDIARRFATVADSSVLSRLDVALHAVRRSAYRMDEIAALERAVERSLSQAAQSIGLDETGDAEPRRVTPLAMTVYRLLQLGARAPDSATLNILEARMQTVAEGREAQAARVMAPLPLTSVFDLKREQFAVENQAARDIAEARRLLKALSSSLSASAAATADDASAAIVVQGRRGLLVTTAVLGATLGLLFLITILLRRHIISPVLEASAALNKVEAERRPVTLPPAAFEELDYIRRSVERFGRALVETHETATALRQSEERMRRVLASSPLPIAIWRQGDGGVLYANDQALKLFGVREGEALSDFARSFSADHHELEAVRHKLEARGRCDDHVLQFRRTDGRAFWSLVSAANLNYGGETAVFMAFTDVTARIEEAHALESAKEQAEAANKAKSTFLATMSHEIRTPMNGVLGMIHLLLETRMTRKQREYAEIIRDAGEGLLAIINDALDISRLEAGRLDLEPVDFDPGRLIEDVMLLMSPRAREKGLRLDSSVGQDLPDWVRADKRRLRQVLLNLLSNAVKFTEEGSVTVEIDTDDGARSMTVKVRDTGIGIPDDKRANLFTEFYQVDNTIARRYGGTGLGLAICKGLVEAMGGELGVESSHARGSTFWFRLPLQPAETEGGDADRAAGYGTPPPKTRTRAPETVLPSLQVLLVEDVELNRQVVREMLERDGHRLQIAGNGREAVNAAGATAFDVVLMDVHLPQVDGVEATRAIRRLPDPDRASVAILGLTADATPALRNACIAAGMNDLLYKPVDPDALRRALARVADLPEDATPLPSTHPDAPDPAPAPAPAGQAPRKPEPKDSKLGEVVAGETPPEEQMFGEPLVDEAFLAERYEGLPAARLRVFLDILTGSAPDLLRTMQDSLDQAETAELRSAAHKLRGSSAVMGLAALNSLSGEIEEACTTGDTQTLDSLVAQAEPLYERSMTRLRDTVDTWDDPPARAEA